MKILLLTPSGGFSFVNQAKGLSLGLTKRGVENKIIRIVEDYPAKQIADYKPDLIVGVGSWHEYDNFVKKPQEQGFRAIPWIVSDEKIENFQSELNKLSLILTPSEQCKNVFVKGGINENVVSVLPEAVDDNFWKSLSEEENKNFGALISVQDSAIELPVTYDLLLAKIKKIPIMFTTGGDVTSKGAQEVITALGKYCSDLPWIYILKTWPSTGSFSRSIEELKLAEEYKVLDKIRYISGEFSPEFIRGLMNLCDIYVAPSRGEGFGLPLVEAQMCGKPIITMDANSTREVVSKNKTGFVVKALQTENGPRADIEDLGQSLRKLLTDQTLRESFGNAARAYAIESFSPEVIAKKFLDLISVK